MKKNLLYLSLLMLILCGCTVSRTLKKHGRHYQQHQDFYSLAQVVELLPMGSDTMHLQKILGEPIDMGFDYRYLLDSVGPGGCVVGAVFHLNEKGRVDQKWLDEICE